MQQKNVCDPINVLRAIACLIVFIMHTLIFTQMAGVNLFNYKSPFIFLLKTPAWAGVWIFFILSGYLAGKSFFNNKYEYSPKGFLKYYWKKVIRIVIPVYAFILVTCCFAFPDFLPNNTSVLLRLITFNYNGNPGVDGIGALWYVSCIVQMYVLAPFICLIFHLSLGKIKNTKVLKLVTIIIFLLITTIGVCYRLYNLEKGLDWYEHTYTNTIANLDLFVGGIVFNFITKNNPIEKLNNPFKIILKILACLILMVTIIFASYLYFNGDRPDLEKMHFFQYYFPSFFLLVVCFYLFVFDYKKDFKRAPLTGKTLLKNPARALDFLSDISLEFYMFHSLILNKIWSYVGKGSGLSRHFTIMIVAFIITTIIAYGYHRIFTPKKR